MDFPVGMKLGLAKQPIIDFDNHHVLNHLQMSCFTVNLQLETFIQI